MKRRPTCPELFARFGDRGEPLEDVRVILAAYLERHRLLGTR
jgi:hypothetical protein